MGVWAAAGAAAGAGTAQENAPPVRGAIPTPQEISRALAHLEADPNLAPVRTIRTLHWRASQAQPIELPPWLRWLRSLRWLAVGIAMSITWLAVAFAWLAQSSRVLLWVGAAAMAGVLVVYVARLARRWSPSSSRGEPAAPSFVRDLDIRPEGLPADIGAAARVLWDGGNRREALALLYRGMLSRLVHLHGVPIRDSSTEEDCLVLAARQLDETRQRYATQLVRTWQLAVYGGAELEGSVIHALCADFARALDAEPIGTRTVVAGPSGAPA